MKYKCEQCGKIIERYPCQTKGKKYIFCSRTCLGAFRSAGGYPHKANPTLSEYNRQHNKERMTPEVRTKLRESRLGKGECKTYTKIFGRHTHRVVAEQMLGRPLKPGEVVHHINRDKRDNRPENLMIFASQAEHARWHAEHDKREEVMPSEVHTPQISGECDKKNP